MINLSTLERLSQGLLEKLPTGDGNRRDFLKAISGGFAASMLPSELEARVDYSKIPVPKVGYTPIVKEQNFSGISLLPTETEVGRVQRALRWANITRAVENRYSIPENLLLGMICAESEGDPTQPNARGDGGAGLIHMQPKMSTEYGLKLISPSKKLVDYGQGRLLRKAIEETRGDLKKLIKYDDRFHPIKNIDAAARMLLDLYFNQNPRTRTWARALERYAGRPTYDSKVLGYAAKMSNPKFRRLVEFNFDSANRNLMIGGRPLTFNRYISIFHYLNRNYGLDLYSRLPRHS